MGNRETKGRLRLAVLPQVWHANGRCIWKGQGVDGSCIGAECRHHTATVVRCSLDSVGAVPGGMSHRRVGAILGISDVQVVKDEARAIAKLAALSVDWEELEARSDHYSSYTDNGARETSELWAILKARRTGSKSPRGR